MKPSFSPFEATASELNAIKLTKMMNAFGYFGGELIELSKRHSIMLENLPKANEINTDSELQRSNQAYDDCLAILANLKREYLSVKDSMESTLKEASSLLIKGYAPDDEDYW